MPSSTNRITNPSACLRRLGLAAAIGVVSLLAPLAAPSDAAAGVAILDDPIFFVRLQDDSDVAVRCGASGTIEVVVNGVPHPPLRTPCAEIRYIEVNAAGSGSNVLDVSGVTKESFPALPAVNGILVEAGTGDDTLIGSPFADLLPGGDGNDRIIGGAGDDNINGGAGADEIDCGDGVDLLTYISDHDGVRVDLTRPGPYAGGEAEGDTATGCEHLRGGTGADRLTGVPGPYDVDGAPGDDLLVWLPGNRLAGGPGTDTVSFVRATQGVVADLTRQSVSGSAGDFSLTGFEHVVGSRYDDRLIGDAGPNRITGGAGDDRIEGGAGDDTLLGGAGDDRVYGQAGADRLVGGPGNDQLVGGPGRDRCSGGPGRNRLLSC